MRSSLLVFFLVLATFLVATANAQNSSEPAAPNPPPPETQPPPPPPPPVSTWTPVANESDLTIQQVGQFAVGIYALSTNELKMSFEAVISGETQPYNGGYNYKLLIKVSGGKKAPQYDAFVWGILGTMSWKLLSFTPHY